MNTNLIHNVLNFLIAGIAALSVPEVVALFPPELALKIVGALGVAKLVINTVRDGFTGLTKEQPPVK